MLLRSVQCSANLPRFRLERLLHLLPPALRLVIYRVDLMLDVAFNISFGFQDSLSVEEPANDCDPGSEYT